MSYLSIGPKAGLAPTPWLAVIRNAEFYILVLATKAIFSIEHRTHDYLTEVGHSYMTKDAEEALLGCFGFIKTDKSNYSIWNAPTAEHVSVGCLHEDNSFVFLFYILFNIKGQQTHNALIAIKLSILSVLSLCLMGEFTQITKTFSNLSNSSN